ncbi:MAG: hypothetical protein M1816_003709 [Peltula sp. TS41687]|nr:MAG: hypothetical protein M1816_003709 [Peltula sp. TS41687]
MASTSPMRQLTAAIKPFRRKECCRLVQTAHPPQRGVRQLSSTACQLQEGVINTAERPRWSYTPEAMKAPVRHRPGQDPRFSWKVNEDPILLDRMYNKLLGKGGEKMLTEEVKWLAVTHKSFDQGRRGYNDRLAFMGRRVVTLHASFAIINSNVARQQQNEANIPADDELHDRTPFQHPALEGIDELTEKTLFQALDRKRLAGLARRCGLVEVMRWLPRRPDNLKRSGIQTVASEALYAIVGAIALQKGGDAAAKVTRDRILNPLGVV